jgi:hypothetical protein
MQKPGYEPPVRRQALNTRKCSRDGLTQLVAASIHAW